MEHHTGMPDPSGHDVIGTEPSARRRVGRRSTAVAAGALVLLAGGGAAAWAASSTPSPSPGTSQAPGQPGYGATGPHGHGLRGARLGALHGELTVPDGASGYKQVLVQRGAVTAVSKDSLTVKSDDGFVATYKLTASTLVNGKAGDSASLAVGDTVGVLADADGTATRVAEPRARADADGPDVEDRVPGMGMMPPGAGRHHGPGPGNGSANPSPGTTQGQGSSLSSAPRGRTA